MSGSNGNTFPGGAPSVWDHRNVRRHAECRIFDVDLHDCVRRSDGKEGSFFVIETRDWVNVLPVTRNGEMVLVRQYRYGTRELSWEIPGGIIETGEAPAAAGERELREETGYGNGTAGVIATCAPNPAIMNNRCHLVLAEGLAPAHETAWDPSEELEIRTIPLAEAVEWASTGRIMHVMSLWGILLLPRLRPDLFPQPF